MNHPFKVGDIVRLAKQLDLTIPRPGGQIAINELLIISMFDALPYWDLWSRATTRLAARVLRLATLEDCGLLWVDTLVLHEKTDSEV